jgi:hypothetical protein
VHHHHNGGGGFLGFGPFGFGAGNGFGYGYGYPYWNNGYNTYAYAVPNATASSTAPYLTDQYYEPGDGFRYPLYYNPATGQYFYYPSAR